MANSKSTRAGKAQSSPSPLTGINEPVLLDLIEQQRAKLYNLLGSLHCVATTLGDEQNDEAGGAVELAADELQRVLDALDQVNLLRAAREGTKVVEEMRTASEAARGLQS